MHSRTSPIQFKFAFKHEEDQEILNENYGFTPKDYFQQETYQSFKANKDEK